MKFTNMFTTAAASGVSLRYLGVIIGSALTVVGILGWLTPEQIETIQNQVPSFVEAIGTLMTVVITAYAIITKSSSDKAAEAGKQIDAKLPKSEDVVIKTPDTLPDIKVAVKEDGTLK